MKKSSVERTLTDFYLNMSMDFDFLEKIEESKVVVKSVYEKRHVFETFVFSVCANWEILVEELIIDCFNKDTSAYQNYTGYEIKKHLPRVTCKAILLGTTYFDFKSVSDLKQKAKLYLVPECNPFKVIPKAKGTKIDDFFALRNYLAHYSDYAKRKLREIYEKRYGLHSFREPGDFLFARDSRKKICRMHAYINNFIEVADEMWDFLVP